MKISAYGTSGMMVGLQINVISYMILDASHLSV